MKLLLDTHVLLWSATAPDRLAPDARAVLEEGTRDAAFDAYGVPVVRA
jgi:PIN domain nuclease of toxin-antitoxin system